jgi:hypothetical protein
MKLRGLIPSSREWIQSRERRFTPPNLIQVSVPTAVEVVERVGEPCPLLSARVVNVHDRGAARDTRNGNREFSSVSRHGPPGDDAHR